MCMLFLSHGVACTHFHDRVVSCTCTCTWECFFFMTEAPTDLDIVEAPEEASASEHKRWNLETRSF